MTEAHTVEGMAADHALAGVREQLEQIEAALLRAAEADSPMVTEAAQHIIAAGGKRFRPLLVVLGCTSARTPARTTWSRPRWSSS